MAALSKHSIDFLVNCVLFSELLAGYACCRHVHTQASTTVLQLLQQLLAI